MPNSPFQHLALVLRERGTAKLEGGGSEDEAVSEHKVNRAAHSAFLTSHFSSLSDKARQAKERRQEQGLPEIKGGVPFLLKIPDEDGGAIEFIAEKLGLEIVAEYDDGFLIVAGDDIEFQGVLEKARDFAQHKHGATGMASILEVDPDPLSDDRIKRILEGNLYERWPFDDSTILVLDVSVEAAAFGFPKRRRLGPKPTDEAKFAREEKYKQDQIELYEAWDEKRIEREIEIEEIVLRNGGEICRITSDPGIIEFSDSFTVRIKMTGQGFKDLIHNYPNVFEVSAPDDIGEETPLNNAATPDAANFELLPPDTDSPIICIVDSGIQEGHHWLEPAILKDASRCFNPEKHAGDVADTVRGGGHGTRVAGACLFPISVHKDGSVKAPFQLINARLLDENNSLGNRVSPSNAIQTIVKHYKSTHQTRIYQHSIGSKIGFRPSRMSVWAAMLDFLSYKHDALFIQAAGNIYGNDTFPGRPSVSDHLAAGVAYPHYLYEPSSRICNPAQSLQAITVGSISGAIFKSADTRSIGNTEQAPSAFSRSGFGMWDSIKPDVVELGGDYVQDTGNPPRISTPPEVCPELVRSTLHGGPAHGRDGVGTSFAAPKVAHIAGLLEASMPQNSTLLYRALIVNSARWPAWAEEAPESTRHQIVRSIGYGLPNVSRATENTPTRVTLVTSNAYEIRAREGLIFGVPIPVSLRPQGESFKVRIDVTLSYVSEPRRTRKSRRGYLGVWLDWKASKKRELFDTFCARALKESDGGDGIHDGNFRWFLGNKKERDGETNGVSRRNGTVQKDWTIVNSFDLPDIFGVVVRGHEGWDRHSEDATAKFELAISFDVIGADIPIYERVRAAIEAEVGDIETQAEVSSAASGA